MIFDKAAFEGRHVLVTGASSGIGRAVATHLARHGARVCLVARNEERLRVAADGLDGEGHQTLSIDLSQVEAVGDAITAAAKSWGAFDAAFHSAGTSLLFPAKLLKDAQLDSMFAANVRGAFGVAKACAKKAVLADGGSLLFMSSVAGRRGRSGMSVYSAAKAAVDGMVRSLAAELAGRGVRVNSISAGAVETEMHESLVTSLNDAGVEEYRNLHMLGFGTTDDIAHAALFLLSPASRWITGSIIPVDGGYTAK